MKVLQLLPFLSCKTLWGKPTGGKTTPSPSPPSTLIRVKLGKSDIIARLILFMDLHILINSLWMFFWCTVQKLPLDNKSSKIASFIWYVGVDFVHGALLQKKSKEKGNISMLPWYMPRTNIFFVQLIKTFSFLSKLVNDYSLHCKNCWYVC